MKKILLLATGGTVASSHSGEGMAPTLGGKDMVALIPELDGLCEISCKIILNLDSTNIQPEDWRVIASEAYAGLKDHDGVVITHGTDTMAYTSSILSFILKSLSKPVILTGSQKSIIDPDTDGKINILNAFRTAIYGMPGVYVVFGDKIISGVRARKIHTVLFDAFDSINANLAGRISGDRVIWERPVPEPDGDAALDSDFDENVFLLKLIPGTRPEMIDSLVSLGYRGIVIEGFGSGNLPNVRRDLLPAVRRAVGSGIPVVVITQCDRGGADMSIYEVGVKALGAGVICGYDMTSETAVTKLMWALGHASELSRVREIMGRDYCGEITVRKG